VGRGRARGDRCGDDARLTVKLAPATADVAVGMHREGSPIRLVVAALGAMLMAVSVYLPWYSLALTAEGAAGLNQLSQQVSQQYGNAALQSFTQSYQSYVGKLVGTPFAAASAHQTLHVVSVLLVVLAVLAVLDALVPLAGRFGDAGAVQRLPYGAGGSLPLLGLVACLLIGYRMAVPPLPAGGAVSLSLREGAWLSLAGAGTVLVAGVWPLFARAEKRPERAPEDVFAQLSGFSPQA
jgi:hypothetical protein